MSSPSTPQELARIKEALGCIVIGMVVSSILYGITILQTFIYYRENVNDFMRVKVLVGLLCFFDTVATVSITIGAWIFFVEDFSMQATMPVVKGPPALALETGANAFIAALTQLFFAYRLWIFSGKNTVLTGAIVAFALLSLGPGLWTAAFFLDASSLFHLATTKVRIIASLANGLSAICDILIALGLCYYLHISRSGFKNSDSIIDRLMLYMIECGALTALCQTCILVTFAVLPGRLVFIPFQLVVGKLYCNALLATLNVRKSIRALSPGNFQELGSTTLGQLCNVDSDPSRRPSEAMTDTGMQTTSSGTVFEAYRSPLQTDWKTLANIDEKDAQVG
ncbi:hypothetical protein LXA43DRAFT_1092886 [Ganoderma leucocontextum]|nr:hypothetical protein LXA43DRAFT_1092886 [Ganoderma leucocontextum]